MTKKEFKYIIAETAYIKDNGQIDYGEILSMIMLANEYHKKDCEKNGYNSLASALKDENESIANRWFEINHTLKGKSL